jgi:hypothetical protein
MLDWKWPNLNYTEKFYNSEISGLVLETKHVTTRDFTISRSLTDFVANKTNYNPGENRIVYNTFVLQNCSNIHSKSIPFGTETVYRVDVLMTATCMFLFLFCRVRHLLHISCSFDNRWSWVITYRLSSGRYTSDTYLIGDWVVTKSSFGRSRKEKNS